eukprot:scaffold26043_cov61-Phaeocystis_antarctica.AAC.6
MAGAMCGATGARAGCASCAAGAGSSGAGRWVRVGGCGSMDAARRSGEPARAANCGVPYPPRAPPHPAQTSFVADDSSHPHSSAARVYPAASPPRVASSEGLRSARAEPSIGSAKRVFSACLSPLELRVEPSDEFEDERANFWGSTGLPLQQQQQQQQSRS